DVRVSSYDQASQSTPSPPCTCTLGAIDPTQINWKSLTFNGGYSKFIGTHTFKVGGDFRKIGLDTFIPGAGSGFFDFYKDSTSSDGGAGSSTDGNSFASFLLGYPSSQSSRQSIFPISTPLNVYLHYY